MIRVVDVVEAELYLLMVATHHTLTLGIVQVVIIVNIIVRQLDINLVRVVMEVENHIKEVII
jgi:hypothetical protein